MEAGQIKTVIERALVSFTGQTTANGNVGGTTLLCSALTTRPDFDGQKVIIADGAYAGQVRDIDGATTAGTVTVTPALGGQIITGVNFYIIADLPMTEEAAAITSELAKVPKSDAAVTWNATALASVNAEVDSALDTAIPATPTPDSINALIKTGAQGTTGLCYKGIVTNWVNATQFAALSLAGFGNQAFANGQYFIFVFRDAGGAAAMPQSEFRVLQTYVSDTGMFTHEAFSVDLTNDDVVLIIHQSLLFPGAVPGFGAFDTSSATLPADSTRAARYPWEVADHFKGMLLMPLEGTCRFITRRITGFTVAGGIFTIEPDNPFPAATGNVEYLILGGQTDFTLLARLTAARAGYLDNINQAGLLQVTAARAALLDQITALRMAELDAANIPADIGTLLARVTAAVALASVCTEARLAELDAANIPATVDTIQGLVDTAEVAGPYSYLDAGGEQDVYEDTATTRRHIRLEFSNRNMVQAGTFKLYRKVDGTNYDLWASQAVTVGASDERAFDAEFSTNQAWKLTYTESADEGAARAIPYNVIIQVVE